MFNNNRLFGNYLYSTVYVKSYNCVQTNLFWVRMDLREMAMKRVILHSPEHQNLSFTTEYSLTSSQGI